MFSIRKLVEVVIVHKLVPYCHEIPELLHRLLREAGGVLRIRDFIVKACLLVVRGAEARLQQVLQIFGGSYDKLKIILVLEIRRRTGERSAHCVGVLGLQRGLRDEAKQQLLFKNLRELGIPIF